MKKTTWIAAALVALTSSALPARASAQELLLAATGDISSGVEGGGKGYAKGLRRVRTMIRVGGEARINEQPKDALAASLIVELEPRTAVGAEARYVRLVTTRLALSIGLIGIISPDTLFGAQAGAEFRLPVSKKVSLGIGPSLNGFFLGTDLPDNLVIWQGVLHVGAHVDL